MKENSKFNFDKHPLWQLSRFITKELLNTLIRLETVNYQDENETLFQVFLQDEASERVTRAILPSVNLPVFSADAQKPVIADPKERKEYEKGWNILFLRARMKPFIHSEMQREIDSLYEIWKKAEKVVVPFSAN